MAYLYMFRELWRYAHGHRWKAVTFVILHILSTAAPLVQPLVFANILNAFQTQEIGLIDDVLYWLGIWVVLFVWFNVFHRVAQYFLFDVAYRIKQNFINHHYQMVTDMPLQWHSDNHSGQTINRINTAADAVSGFCEKQHEYIPYFMMLVGPLVMLAWLSWQVAVVALIIAVISVVIMWVFDKKLVVLYRDINEKDHKIAAKLYDYISNIKTIITLRLNKKTARELDHVIEAGHKPYMDAETKIDQFKWLCVSTGRLLLEAGVIFYYIRLIVQNGGQVLVGNIVAVFQYLQQLSQTYLNIAQKYQQVIAWKTDMEAILPMVDVYQSIQQSVDSDIPEHIETIDITGLNFSYGNGEGKTLKDVSVTLKSGENIALVGESGSGKSTLISLLRGLHPCDTVSMVLNGQSYDSLAPLSRITTLIPQEPEIFEDTVLFNITVGIDYDQADIDQAITLAQFQPVLDKLPHGLQTDMREKGVTLSGGERQRLALARGLLAAKNSQIILLDEPTSSVDTKNEGKIYNQILSHFADKMIISSCHRPYLFNKFDRIITLNNGQIVVDE